SAATAAGPAPPDTSSAVRPARPAAGAAASKATASPAVCTGRPSRGRPTRAGGTPSRSASAPRNSAVSGLATTRSRSSGVRARWGPRGRPEPGDPTGPLAPPAHDGGADRREREPGRQAPAGVGVAGDDEGVVDGAGPQEAVGDPQPGQHPARPVGDVEGERAV